MNNLVIAHRSFISYESSRYSYSNWGLCSVWKKLYPFFQPLILSPEVGSKDKENTEKF